MQVETLVTADVTPAGCMHALMRTLCTRTTTLHHVADSTQKCNTMEALDGRPSVDTDHRTQHDPE